MKKNYVIRSLYFKKYVSQKDGEYSKEITGARYFKSMDEAESYILEYDLVDLDCTIITIYVK